MLAILVACVVALCLTLFGTPFFIRFLIKNEYGQFIRQDGPTSHFTKRGTPTMGGVVIIFAALAGYAVAHLVEGRVPDISGLLLLFLVVGLGFIGFLDDYIKISRQHSLGLNPKGKIIGQILVASVFAIGALQFKNSAGLTPASTKISLFRDLPIDLAYFGAGAGVALFLLWANFLVSAWSNAVNLTDGLDGLAAGASVMVFGAYTMITIWMSYHSCMLAGMPADSCYDVRDPRGLAIVAAALVGACFGFLWWNGSPAQIFMGDTGALALGGAVAGLSILTRTQVLAVIIGGLFVIIVLSDVIQIGFFKMTRRRVFKMAPLHHHFELKGWQEITIVIRFWIIAALSAALGVALFYADWLAK